MHAHAIVSAVHRLALLALALGSGCLLEFDPALVEDAPRTTIAPGVVHTCATRADDTLWCWGNNAYGALGRPGASDSSEPLQVGQGGWQHVATDGGTLNFSCGARDGALLCWGADGDAMLGQGRLVDPIPTPTALAIDREVAMVAVGTTVGLALDVDGVLWTWGWNSAALGFHDPDVPYVFVPEPLVEDDDGLRWSFVDFGRIHGCGIRGDAHSLWCWGAPESRALGRDDDARTPAPIEGEPDGWRTVSTGGRHDDDSAHTCAIRRDGTLWCWGTNVDGQLGIADVASSTLPMQVGADDDWRAIACGDRHTCGLRGRGTLWCWGADDEGQLAAGGGMPRAAPAQVGDRDDWIELASGAAHTCGRTRDGELWCWGSNSNGQTGQREYGITPEPSPVDLP